MAHRHYLPEVQDDRVITKLAVVVFLGLLLAAIGGLTQYDPGQLRPERLAMPGTAGPPAVLLE